MNDKLRQGNDQDVESAGPLTSLNASEYSSQPQSELGLGVPSQQLADPGQNLPFTTPDKRSILIKAVIDYVQSMEDNIDDLNSTLGRPRFGKDRGDGKPAAKAPEPGRTVQAGDGLDIRLETKFYPCDDVFGFEGEFGIACDKEMGYPSRMVHPPRPEPPEVMARRLATYRNLRHPNHFTYTCRNEFPYLVRVLYVSTLSNQGPKSKIGESPSADAIDIIGFMVTSRPIADFFTQRLGLFVDSNVLKFGRPFRSVIRNIKYLKDQLSSLAAKYGHQTAEASHKEVWKQDRSSQHSDDHTPSSPPSAQTQFEDSYDQPEAFEHFKQFLDFIDVYLSTKIELFKALKAGARENVAYEDLWMLFDTGDTIYCPSRKNRTVVKKDLDPFSAPKVGLDSDDDSNFHCTRRRYMPQAYRVIATIGGSLLKRSLASKDTTWRSSFSSSEMLRQLFQGGSGRAAIFENQQADSLRRQKMKERFSPLQVICMYIEFNGVKYGTETDIFVFKPFDGEVSIQSLEAYPLQYAGALRADYLLGRGRKFVDITTSSKHMKHAGSASGENKEEVSPILSLYTPNTSWRI